MLGKCYAEGLGVEPNISKAIELITDAADYDAEAQYEMGMRCLEGNGVKKDIGKAVKYLEKSGNGRYHNNAAANYKLGELYYEGKLVKKDDELAKKYWYMSAGCGNQERDRVS